MKREQLIHEVKEEYSKLAEYNKSEKFTDLSDDHEISSDQYYEFVLDKVINMVSYGAFDDFPTGKSVVEAVTNNKNILFEKWDQDLMKQNHNQELL